MENSSGKKQFDWEAGQSLGDGVIPLGNVRKKGQEKLTTALHADQKLRKKQYADDLKTTASEPYQQTLSKYRSKKEEDAEFFVEEESVSGVVGGDEDEAKKLLKQDPGKMKGVNRFGKK